MALSDEKIREYSKRILLARMRLLCNHGFFGLLMMHLKFSIDEKHPTAYTDGERIVFGTEFLETLSDSQLDFVMQHELLHVVLQHCFRGRDMETDKFSRACDIVVNSNILLENGGKTEKITLPGRGVQMHQTPDGKEGHLFTMEQVYGMLMEVEKKKGELKGNQDGESTIDGESDEKDSAEADGKGEGNGNTKKKSKGSGGEIKEDTDSGKDDEDRGQSSGFEKRRSQKKSTKPSQNGSWDDHSKWGTIREEDSALSDVWVKRFENACEAVSIRDPSNSRGLLPAFAQALLKELRKPQTDWRTILNEFVQEEICDYSFSPPDRRFDDSPFFLPDFNEKDDSAEDILFMIDTSGSMSDDMITAAFSEVKGAIDQFNGKLKGWLGFFDAAIIEPIPFESVEELLQIKAAGRGGTDFQIVFEYVAEFMQDKLPVSIIILTDGFAPFPDEKLSMGIPVLWLLNNEEVQPPWGRVARITV